LIVFRYLYSDFLPGRIAAWLVLLMVIFTVGLLLMLTVKRMLNNREERRAENLIDKYETIMTNILFEEAYGLGTKGYIAVARSVKKQNLDIVHHGVLSNLFFQYSSNFQGDSLKTLKQFYEDCGQKKFALRVLKFGEWHEKASVLRELGMMGVSEALGFIKRQVESKNDIIRMQAQFALIYLEGAKGIEFLRTTKRPLSDWQQLRLIEEIESLNFAQIPNFYKLLESQNQTVVVFGLKLIRYFDQIENQNQLLKLVEYSGIKVQTELIKIFRQFGLVSGLDLLIKDFEGLDESIQNECIKLCGDIGNHAHEEFLISCLAWDDYEKRMFALEALHNIGVEIKKKYFGNAVLEPYLKHIHQVLDYELE